MILIDEMNRANVFQIGDEKLIEALNILKRNKEEEIRILREKIVEYEEKRRTEDALYRSLSPIKKLFTSRAPIHHQAVEYMVYVKDRFKTIEKLKQKIVILDKQISLVHSKNNTDDLLLSGLLMEEIKAWKEAGGS